ncbi:MAG: hypothetical protein AAF289_18120, partial [Cyanobacteria bacterium P01_A01_bin.135]
MRQAEMVQATELEQVSFGLLLEKQLEYCERYLAKTCRNLSVYHHILISKYSIVHVGGLIGGLIGAAAGVQVFAILRELGQVDLLV